MSGEKTEPGVDIPEEGTWVDAVDAFKAEADWLTGADRPQLKALYAIARALDSGTFQAALISQYTLIHRTLNARRPGGDDAGPREPDLLDMLDKNPGALWRANPTV